MIKKLSLIALLILLTDCQLQKPTSGNIITSDIPNFWNAYDQITATKDSALQYTLLHDLYLNKGTDGLKALIRVRNYTPKDYIDAINQYPNFWSSVRSNTLTAQSYSIELEKGISKLRSIYPQLRPAKIYFSIGALRTNGTALNNLVLVGSELAMTDTKTITTDFPTKEAESRRLFFDTNPIKHLSLLNVHEYIHTQQEEMVHDLLFQVLYEGVAEFVSTKAMGVPSASPAIEFGKNNYEAIRDQFEKEMFYSVNLNNWLWSSQQNVFNIRDLGYYIGYQICETYYTKAKDKKAAIKKLIELNYTDAVEIEEIINSTHFFTAPITQLRASFEEKRPTVIAIKEFKNNDLNIDPKVKEITFEFSEPLNGYHTGMDFGPIGENGVPKILKRSWSTDAKSYMIAVELEPNKHYQLFIGNNFRTKDNRPLKPYLINFKTKN